MKNIPHLIRIITQTFHLYRPTTPTLEYGASSVLNLMRFQPLLRLASAACEESSTMIRSSGNQTLAVVQLAQIATGNERAIVLTVK